jgi:hypothetical protein
MTPDELIAEERVRQISQEGWSREHDATHDSNEMYDAAIVYLNFGTDAEGSLRDDGTPEQWPWDKDWFKPKSRLRNLVRSGSLFVAEKERRIGAGLSLGDIEDRLKQVITAIATLPT